MQQPEIKKKRGISPIWILPFVALLVGGWLLYKGVRDAGVDIVVHFESAEGITAGKTKVMYKGIPIGVVREMTVAPEMRGVALGIEIDKRAEKELVEDVKFWIVKPEVSAGRISGLDTMLSGSYIQVEKGSSTTPAREFIGLAEPPALPQNAPGLHFTLLSDTLGSIQRGTNIYFKNIVVGSIQGYELVDGKGVKIHAHVEEEYADLIKTTTRFWNSSGITFKGGISGFKVHMESMASLVYGGVSLHTPKQKKNSPQAKNGHVFNLYEDFDAADYGIKMTLRLPSAMGLTEEVSKVVYRGFEVGRITSFSLNDDEKRSVTAHILFNPEAEFALRAETLFWVVEPQFSVNRVKNLETIVKGTHITFKPGTGEFKTDFVAVEQPKEDEILKPGQKITLIAESSHSISIGAPVYFKKMQVGEVTGFDLTADGEKVEVKIFIHERYSKLVTPKSVFWKVGGIKFNASLDGVSVETGPVTSLIAGAVTFANTTSADKTKNLQLQQNQAFFLHKSFHEATKAIPSLQPLGLKIKVRAQTAKFFSIGSPVLYKHIEVGEVMDVSLAENSQDIILDLFIDEKYAHLLKTTSRFYNFSGIEVEGGFNGLEVKTGSMKSILRGGISFFTPADGDPAQSDTPFILYDDYKTASDADKTTIFLHFAKPHGLKKNIEIRYHGVTVGHVSEITYGQDLQSVEAKALIDTGMERLFRDDSRLWLVTAEFSIKGVEHLDTLVKGPYIAVLPGKGKPVLELTALEKPPSIMDEEVDGMRLVLVAPTLGSLKPNSPVYYRQVRVGRVVGSALSSTSRDVLIHITIDKPYDALIHEKTVFWNAAGINVDAGLFSGVQIYAESFESILAGGIAFATPENDEMGDRVKDGHSFKLHGTVNEKWLAWRPEIILEQAEIIEQ